MHNKMVGIVGMVSRSFSHLIAHALVETATSVR